MKLPSGERTGKEWAGQAGGTKSGQVIAYLGQQVAQLRLSLKAPQPSRVRTGHVHYQVVRQGAQDANPLRVVRSSVHRGLILPQVYSQWQPLCEDRSSRFCPQAPFPVQHAEAVLDYTARQASTSAWDLPGARGRGANTKKAAGWGCLLTAGSSLPLRSNVGATTGMFYCIVPFLFLKI